MGEPTAPRKRGLFACPERCGDSRRFTPIPAVPLRGGRGKTRRLGRPSVSTRPADRPRLCRGSSRPCHRAVGRSADDPEDPLGVEAGREERAGARFRFRRPRRRPPSRYSRGSTALSRSSGSGRRSSTARTPRTSSPGSANCLSHSPPHGAAVRARRLRHRRSDRDARDRARKRPRQPPSRGARGCHAPRGRAQTPGGLARAT